MTGTAGQLQPASILPSRADKSGLLVVRLRSIGDIVLLTPALALLMRWRADLKISVLVESRFSQLLEASPDIDRIIVYPRPFPRNTGRRAGLGTFLGKISETAPGKSPGGRQPARRADLGAADGGLRSATARRIRPLPERLPLPCPRAGRPPDSRPRGGPHGRASGLSVFLVRIVEERSPIATALPAGRVERRGTGPTAACGSRAGSALCGSPPAGALCYKTVAAGTIRRDGKDARE